MGRDVKILEVLIEIVNNLLNHANKDIEDIEKEIVEKLIDKGYKVEEINDLLDSVFELMNIKTESEEVNLRVITPEEFINFEEEAREYLIYLKNSMIIDEWEFEEALYRLSRNKDLNKITDIELYLKSRGINTNITTS